MPPKTVTVFGATGHQGGAVARALAADPENFIVRGITRDVQQDVKIDDLKSAGVTVIQCDLDNANSIKMALNDADGCFIVTYTDFTEPDCIEKEKERGENIANACVAAGVPHVIYSTQLHTTRVKGIEVRHLVAKAELEDSLKSKNIPLTCFLVPCYYENFYDFLKPRRTHGDNFVLEIPMGETPLDLIDVNDIGQVARTVFLNKANFLEKTLSLCGDKQTIRDIAAEFTKHLSPMVFKDKPITANDYKKLGQPWSVDFGNMFEFFARKDQRYNVQHTKNLYHGTHTLQQWLEEYERIDLCLTGLHGLYKDCNDFGKVKLMSLVAPNCTCSSSHPISWGHIIDEIKENLDHLPGPVKELYTTSAGKQIRERLCNKFRKLMRESHIDDDIRREIEAITRLERRLVHTSSSQTSISYVSGSDT